MCLHHTHSLETPFENYCPIGIIHQTMEGTHYPCFMYVSQHIHVFNIQFTVAIITWEIVGMIECMSS